MKNIVLRTGFQMQVSDEEAAKLEQVVQSKGTRFVRIRGEYINIADVTAIASDWLADGMENTRQGNWMCKHGHWHRKVDKCDCAWKKLDEGDGWFSSSGTPAIEPPDDLKLPEPSE